MTEVCTITFPSMQECVLKMRWNDNIVHGTHDETILLWLTDLFQSKTHFTHSQHILKTHTHTHTQTHIEIRVNQISNTDAAKEIL